MTIQQIATLALEAPMAAAVETIALGIEPEEVAVEMYAVDNPMDNDTFHTYVTGYLDLCQSQAVKSLT